MVGIVLVFSLNYYFSANIEKFNIANIEISPPLFLHSTANRKLRFRVMGLVSSVVRFPNEILGIRA